MIALIPEASPRNYRQGKDSRQSRNYPTPYLAMLVKMVLQYGRLMVVLHCQRRTVILSAFLRLETEVLHSQIRPCNQTRAECMGIAQSG